MSSHEDHKCWNFLFEYVKNQNVEPKVNLADGDKAITKSLKQVFSNNIKRTMCWSHVFTNLKKKMAGIKGYNPKIAKEIENDIKDLQWTAIDEETFDKAYYLLVNKWTEKTFDETLSTLIGAFFNDYFTAQWVESEVKYWFASSNPFHIGNNQGLEGKNNDIKKSHTFRRRLRIPALFECILNMVHEWSREDDQELFVGRNDKIELKVKDAGYEWKRNNDKIGRILSVSSSRQFTVMENKKNIIHGKVMKLWIVPSSQTKSDDLKILAKNALKQRNEKNFESFDDYIKD